MDLAWFVLVVFLAALGSAVALFRYGRWQRGDSLAKPSTQTIVVNDFGWLLGLSRLWAGRARARAEADLEAARSRAQSAAFERQFRRDMEFAKKPAGIPGKPQEHPGREPRAWT